MMITTKEYLQRMLKMAKFFGNSHICEGFADVKRKQQDDNGMKDLVNDLGKVSFRYKGCFPFLFHGRRLIHDKARATAERVSLSKLQCDGKMVSGDASAVARSDPVHLHS